MSNSRIVEWLNENHERSFPLTENGVRVITSGSTKIDLHGIFLDAVLQYETLPDAVYLESIVSDSTDIVFNITGQTPFTLANYSTIGANTVLTNSMHSRIVVSPDVQTVPHNHSYILSSYSLQVEFEPSVCFEVGGVYRGVTSLAFDDETAVYGEVVLNDGLQLSLEANNSTVQLEAGRNQGIALGCDSVFNLAPVAKLDLVDTVNQAMLEHIKGRTANEESIKLYSQFEWWAELAEYNSNNWALSSGIDLTFCEFKDTSKSTLLTPRHLLIASHVPLDANKAFKFLDMNNVLHVRWSLGRALMPERGGNGDISIFILDYDLPPSIKPAKVLPNNYLNYFRDTEVVLDPSPYHIDNVILPRMSIMNIDQFHSVNIMDTWITGIHPDGSPISVISVPRIPEESNPTYPWREVHGGPYITGDSGCPIFMLIDGECVSWHAITGASGAGFDVAKHSELINTMIATLDNHFGVTSGHQLQTIDLNKYKTYNNLGDRSTLLGGFEIDPTPGVGVLVPQVHRSGSSNPAEPPQFTNSDCDNVVNYINGASPKKSGESLKLEGGAHVKVYNDPDHNRIYLGLDFVAADVPHQRLPNPPGTV